MQVVKENITIVLNKPKFAGNVGAVARCAKNMGFEKICVVAGDHLSREEMRPQATHVAAELVEKILGVYGQDKTPGETFAAWSHRRSVKEMQELFS